MLPWDRLFPLLLLLAQIDPKMKLYKEALILSQESSLMFSQHVAATRSIFHGLFERSPGFLHSKIKRWVFP